MSLDRISFLEKILLQKEKEIKKLKEELEEIYPISPGELEYNIIKDNFEKKQRE